MKAQCVGQRQINAARGEISLRQRCCSRLACAPNHQRERSTSADVSVFFVGDAILAIVSFGFPQKTAFAQDGNKDVTLIAASVAMHQYLVVFARTDRKTWFLIIVQGTLRDPAIAGFVPSEGLSDGLWWLFPLRLD